MTAVELRRAERAGVDIKAHGISRVYGSGRRQHVALSNVSFDVAPGEFISVVGPSGCGKSTLLKMVAGLLTCTEGTIFVGGSELREPRDEIGLMFQTATLFPWRNIRKNILLPFEVRRDRTADREQRLAEVLELVGLAGLEKSFPRQLSGGMQQRVALCRLLVCDPSLLLMDEPFGALDEFTRERLNVELARITEHEGKTAMFVTHNISEAVFLADRVIVMGTNPGRILDIVDVNLPRPREAHMLTSVEQLQLVNQVRDVLGLA